MLFLQGTKDELASYDLVVKLCASLGLATLVTIDGANHAFKAGKKDLMPLLTEACATWIDKHLTSDADKES
jgi:hypothetical protein